ncbi:MAG: hypothetical protein M8353_09660 [ANME-2 cluster archaeon]|nr:hypothetical protein [ANME-2 cluster archaeon]
MKSAIENTYSQNFLAIQYSLIMAIVSTAIIYILDKFIFGHTDFRPLTEFQFYFVLFIVVFGLVAGLLFYREEKEDIVEDVSEFRIKMAKKKLKKAKKTKAQGR